MASRGLIKDIVVTPVAFHDMPLLNSIGIHEPYALRSIVEVVADDGTYGLGESYGDRVHLDRLEKAAKTLIGLSVCDTTLINQKCVAALADDTGPGWLPPHPRQTRSFPRSRWLASTSRANAPVCP